MSFRRRAATSRRLRMAALTAWLAPTHASRQELLASGWSSWQIGFLLGAPDLVRRGAHWWLREKVARRPAGRVERLQEVQDLRCAMRVHLS